MSNDVDYSAYQRLRISLDGQGLLQLRFGEPGRLPVADAVMHHELAAVWRDIDADARVRAVLVASDGKGFLAGGDLEGVARISVDAEARLRVWQEARDLVHNLVNCQVPVVSAVHGPAVGAGLALALLADICIVTPDARLIDGHMRLGVAAGDHAAMVWPLACGLARSKYYLLLGEELLGQEAERLGLVARCVPAESLNDVALGLAQRLARGPRQAQRMTKHALNHWLRAALPTFEASLGMEMLGFGTAEAREGLDALRERRAPDFP
jgi:enoyl-CoA hydratase